MMRSNWWKRALGIGLAAASCWAAGDLRLIEAVKHRDTKAFETLAGTGADIDAVAPDGATALAWAVFLDLQDVAEKLIAKGAKVNTAGDYGETPLTLALANGNARLLGIKLASVRDAADSHQHEIVALRTRRRALTLERDVDAVGLGHSASAFGLEHHAVEAVGVLLIPHLNEVAVGPLHQPVEQFDHVNARAER